MREARSMNCRSDKRPVELLQFLADVRILRADPDGQ